MPQFTIEEIREIAESNDADAIDLVCSAYLNDQDKYSIFDQGRIDEILQTKITEVKQKLNNESKTDF